MSVVVAPVGSYQLLLQCVQHSAFCRRKLHASSLSEEAKANLSKARAFSVTCQHMSSEQNSTIRQCLLLLVLMSSLMHQDAVGPLVLEKG